MSANKFTLGDPVFFSTSQLRAYCENGRNLIRPLSYELHLASEELRGALREVPNMGSWPARVVSAHLRHAADGVDAACVGLIRTFLSFERHYINNTPERSKRHFDLNR